MIITIIISLPQSDWRGEFTNLATADGHAILNIELPWHGGSSSSSSSDDSESTWQRSHRKNHQDDEASCRVSWGLAGVELAAEAVLRVCDAVGAGPYLVVGYSMGGRIALALAGRRPDLLHGGGGVVLVSANPGLTRWEGRLGGTRHRWCLNGRAVAGFWYFCSLFPQICLSCRSYVSSTRVVPPHPDPRLLVVSQYTTLLHIITYSKEELQKGFVPFDRAKIRNRNRAGSSLTRQRTSSLFFEAVIEQYV